MAPFPTSPSPASGASPMGSGGGGSATGQPAAGSTSPGTVTVEYSGTRTDTATNPNSYVSQATESYSWDEKVTVQIPECAASPEGTPGCVLSG
jgi:hypothetical protein